MFDYPTPPFRSSVFSTRVHAVWDYLAGLLLIGSPWLFGFASEPRAKRPIVVAGGLVLLLATVTDYEGGLFRKVLMTLHLGIGSLLGASPWLGDFTDRVYLPHLCLGLLWLLAGRSWEVSRPVRNELNWAKIPLGEIQLFPVRAIRSGVSIPKSRCVWTYCRKGKWTPGN
ncbi:SPW repeat protein [Spirosoma koreense]